RARMLSGRREEGRLRLQTTRGEIDTRLVINCAGLHADRVAAALGEQPHARIVPFRGEYFKLRPERQHLVRNLIYPAPRPAFPFRGVPFPRLIHGGIEAGPNAVLAFSREGYRATDVRLSDLWDALRFAGLWRFVGRHGRMVAAELYRSAVK